MDVSPLQYKKKNKSLTENRDFLAAAEKRKEGGMKGEQDRAIFKCI